MATELDDLEQAIDLALKVDWALHPGARKCEDLAQVSRLRNKLDALDASILTPFDVTLEHRIEGHAGPVDWLKHHTRAKGPEAARRRRLSRRLRRMPAADAAMADGSISAEHVDVLAWASRQVGDATFARIESLLVDAAVEERFSDFELTVQYVVARLAPTDRPEPGVEERFASVSRTFGGNGVVNAQFDPLSFTALQQEVQRLYDHLLAQDRAEAEERLGRPPLHGELGRTARQRRADALVLMAERSAAFTGDLGPSRLELNVHGSATLVACIIAVLRQALAAMEGGEDGDGEEFDLDGALDDIELGTDSLHELDDGTVVTVNTIVLALLTGTIRGILFDPTGEILRYGHRRRLFTPAQARALRAKYRRCCHPFGCDRSAPFVQADHVHEHQDGGPTDIVNGAILDGGHNTWKTNTRNRPPPPGPVDTGQRRLPPDIGPLPR